MCSCLALLAVQQRESAGSASRLVQALPRLASASRCPKAHCQQPRRAPELPKRAASSRPFALGRQHHRQRAAGHAGRSRREPQAASHLKDRATACSPRVTASPGTIVAASANVAQLSTHSCTAPPSALRSAGGPPRLQARTRCCLPGARRASASCLPEGATVMAVTCTGGPGSGCSATCRRGRCQLGSTLRCGGGHAWHLPPAACPYPAPPGCGRWGRAAASRSRRPQGLHRAADGPRTPCTPSWLRPCRVQARLSPANRALQQLWHG